MIKLTIQKEGWENPIEVSSESADTFTNLFLTDSAIRTIFIDNAVSALIQKEKEL